MRFLQTVLLAVLTVAVTAGPIMPRDHPDWDNYKNCCYRRDNYGEHRNCMRPVQWQDDWHDKGDQDPQKWNNDGKKLWDDCRNDWGQLYNTWKNAKAKHYNQHKDKYDREGAEWDADQQIWNNDRDQWMRHGWANP